MSAREKPRWKRSKAASLEQITRSHLPLERAVALVAAERLTEAGVVGAGAVHER